MSAPPYMKLFWGDYHKRTRHLKRDQHGAYFLLIGEAWQLGGSLPDDDAKLAAWALCTPAEWSEMKAVVMEFFTLRRGRWVHERVREELAAYESTSRKRKQAGKSGGIAKAENAKGNRPANARQKPTKPEPEPESEKELFPPTPQGGEKKARRKAAVTIPDGFPDVEALKIARDMVMEAGVALHVRTEADKMRDWAIAKDERKADWLAAWRGWIRRACEGKPRLGLVQTPKDAHDPWPMRMRAWSRQEGWNDVDWGPEPFEPGCRVPAHHLPAQAAE